MIDELAAEHETVLVSDALAAHHARSMNALSCSIGDHGCRPIPRILTATVVLSLGGATFVWPSSGLPALTPLHAELALDAGAPPPAYIAIAAKPAKSATVRQV